MPHSKRCKQGQPLACGCHQQNFSLRPAPICARVTKGLPWFSQHFCWAPSEFPWFLQYFCCALGKTHFRKRLQYISHKGAGLQDLVRPTTPIHAKGCAGRAKVATCPRVGAPDHANPRKGLRAHRKNKKNKKKLFHALMRPTTPIHAKGCARTAKVATFPRVGAPDHANPRKGLQSRSMTTAPPPPQKKDNIPRCRFDSIINVLNSMYVIYVLSLYRRLLNSIYVIYGRGSRAPSGRTLCDAFGKTRSFEKPKQGANTHQARPHPR